MTDHIDTLLLLALPASGKSELRRYLTSLEAETAQRDFGLGPTVQLDDYPYVHLMRRVSQELVRLGQRPVFFASDAEPFLEPRDWGTLIALVDEDYDALGTAPPTAEQPTRWLLERFDRARRAVGAPAPFADMDEAVVAELADALDGEVATMATAVSAELASYDPGVSTVVIEFARGGQEGADLPLPEPYGYGYSLRHLSPEILRRASALYVWVTPEESRRRNDERAVPGREGDASILHHGVPEAVMRGDYGTDDFLWLLDRGGRSAIAVTRDGSTFTITAAVFDNRVDHTSFLRADSSEWDPAKVAELHTRLATSFATLR